MKPRDQRFGLLNGEGVDDRPVLLGNSQAFQPRRRIVFVRMILVAVVEGTANNADRVVVGLLRPLIAIGNFGQFRVSNLIEYSRSNLGSPYLREEFAVPEPVTNAKSFLATRESHSARNSSKT